MLLSDSHYIFMEQMPFLPAGFPKELSARAHLIFRVLLTAVFNGVAATGKRFPTQRRRQAAHHPSSTLAGLPHSSSLGVH